MRPETVTQLRRRLAAFSLCFGFIAIHQLGSTQAQSGEVIADPESYAVFAAALAISRPADRVRCSRKPVPLRRALRRKPFRLNGVRSWRTIRKKMQVSGHCGRTRSWDVHTPS